MSKSLLNKDCPISKSGFPEITSAIATSLLIYFAEDGFIRKFSKFITLTATSNNALNNILKDSSVPFDLYNDLEFFKKSNQQ